MTFIYDWLKKLFTRVPPAQADMLKTIQCPICKAEDSPYPKCGCVTYVEEKP